MPNGRDQQIAATIPSKPQDVDAILLHRLVRHALIANYAATNQKGRCR
jgi:hypothetical protein